MIYAKFVHKGCDGRCGCGCGDSHCGCDHEDHCSCGHDHDHHEHDTSTGSVTAEHHDEPKTKTYKVYGMTCSHCKACVEKAAFALDGVVFAVADVAKKELVIEGSVDESALKATIEEAGFEFGGEA